MNHHSQIAKGVLLLASLSILLHLSLWPDFRTFLAMAQGAPWSGLSLWVMYAAVAWSFIDMIDRHKDCVLPWMLLSVTQIAYVLILVKAGVSGLLPTALLLVGLGSCSVAFWDAHFHLERARSKDVR